MYMNKHDFVAWHSHLTWHRSVLVLICTQCERRSSRHGPWSNTISCVLQLTSVKHSILAYERRSPLSSGNTPNCDTGIESHRGQFECLSQNHCDIFWVTAINARDWTVLCWIHQDCQCCSSRQCYWSIVVYLIWRPPYVLFLSFLPCDYAKHIRTVLLSTSACPSVCLSNACIVTKGKHLAKKVQLWKIHP